MKRSILACLAGLLTWLIVVSLINRLLRLTLPGYTAAEQTLQFTLVIKWARLVNGNRDFSSGGCRHRLDIPIEPLAALDRRRRSAGDVSACPHRDLE